MMPAMTPAVRIEHVSFAFGKQPVLQDIDLCIERGQNIGLVGPNGGGKTTLIRLLVGLIEPTAGTIRIGGVRPRVARRRGDLIGYLPQNARAPATLPLTARQVVRIGLAAKTGMFRPYSAADLTFADTLLERVGMGALADVPVTSLSGGQLQRVLIARALVSRPMLLLLDEPTTGIDRAGQQQFIEFLTDLKRELALTVIFVSHDNGAVSAICDRIVCLDVTLRECEPDIEAHHHDHLVPMDNLPK